MTLKVKHISGTLTINVGITISEKFHVHNNLTCPQTACYKMPEVHLHIFFQPQFNYQVTEVCPSWWKIVFNTYQNPNTGMTIKFINSS